MATSDLVLLLTSEVHIPETGLFVMRFLDAFISQDMQGTNASEVALSEFRCAQSTHTRIKLRGKFVRNDVGKIFVCSPDGGVCHTYRVIDFKRKHSFCYFLEDFVLLVAFIGAETRKKLCSIAEADNRIRAEMTINKYEPTSSTQRLSFYAHYLELEQENRRKLCSIAEVGNLMRAEMTVKRSKPISFIDKLSFYAYNLELERENRRKIAEIDNRTRAEMIISEYESTLFTENVSFYVHCSEQRLHSIAKADSRNMGNVLFSNYERHRLTDGYKTVQVGFDELAELRAFTSEVADGDDIRPDSGVCRIYSIIEHQNQAQSVRAYPRTYRIIDFKRMYGFHSTEVDVTRIDYFNQKKTTRKKYANARRHSNRWREKRARSFDAYSTRQEGGNHG